MGCTMLCHLAGWTCSNAGPSVLWTETAGCIMELHGGTPAVLQKPPSLIPLCNLECATLDSHRNIMMRVSNGLQDVMSILPAFNCAELLFPAGLLFMI